MMKAQTKEDPTESKTANKIDFDHLETTTCRDTSVLQLHLKDDFRRRCEQCIRLDIRGTKNRLRQQDDVMVHVSQYELRPLLVLTNLGRKY